MLVSLLLLLKESNILHPRKNFYCRLQNFQEDNFEEKFWKKSSRYFRKKFQNVGFQKKFKKGLNFFSFFLIFWSERKNFLFPRFFLFDFFLPLSFLKGCLSTSGETPFISSLPSVNNSIKHLQTCSNISPTFALTSTYSYILFYIILFEIRIHIIIKPWPLLFLPPYKRTTTSSWLGIEPSTSVTRVDQSIR